MGSAVAVMEPVTPNPAARINVALCWELIESIAATLIGASLYAEK